MYFRTNVVGTLRPALRAHAGGGCGCGAGAVGLPDRCRVPVPVSGRRQPGASWAAGRVRQSPAPLGACCCNRARSNLFALCSLTAASRFEIWRSPLPWAPPTAAVAREAHRQRALVVELDVGLSLDSRGAGDQVPLAVPGLVGRACSASSSTPRRALAVYFCTNLVGTLTGEAPPGPRPCGRGARRGRRRAPGSRALGRPRSTPGWVYGGLPEPSGGRAGLAGVLGPAPVFQARLDERVGGQAVPPPARRKPSRADRSAARPPASETRSTPEF